MTTTIHHKKPRNQPTKVLDLAPSAIIRQTMSTISAVVGSTLGPFGCPVLMERQEQGLAPFVSKDGVTAFRNLGFANPIADLVCETMRDSAVRTANEAGDGTTTATVLADGLVRSVLDYCAANPRVAPQMVVRTISKLLQSEGLPFLEERAVAASLVAPDGKEDLAGVAMLRAVAQVSANGDADLADAVIRAVRHAGDWGTVVIQEAEGASGYAVEKVPGYSLPVGWEDSMRSLWQNWITDHSAQRCVVSRPRYLCFNGRLSHFEAIRPVLERFDEEAAALTDGDAERLLTIAVEQGCMPKPPCPHTVKGGVCGKPLSPESGASAWRCLGDAHLVGRVIPTLPAPYAAAFGRYQEGLNVNLVVLASGFSDQVLTTFFINFREVDKLKLVPVIAPQGPTVGYQGQVLQDVAALVGARVLDAQAIAAGKFTLADLGPGTSQFEMYRTRSSIVGAAHDLAPMPEQVRKLQGQLATRVSDVSRQLQGAASALDRNLVQERLAKLTGGLACLTIAGASNGDIRERRDRAEDAVCAVRGAIKAGCLPGGGWGLLALGVHLRGLGQHLDLVNQVLIPSLREPIYRMCANAGELKEVTTAAIEKMETQIAGLLRGDEVPFSTRDLVSGEMVDPFLGGLLDSAPAVIEAVRSAASIALQMGTVKAIIAYERDVEVERQEAASAAAYKRATLDEANNRG